MKNNIQRYVLTSVVVLSVFGMFFLAGCANTNSKSILTPTPTPTLSPTQLCLSEEFDGRIGVCITGVQMANVLSSDIANSQLNPSRRSTADAGKTFFIIRLAVTRIEGTHLTSICAYEKERPILYDTGGKDYGTFYWVFNGVQFTDPHDLLSSSEFVVGSKGTIIFEIPVGSEPASLNLVYSYQETLGNQSPSRGEVTITF